MTSSHFREIQPGFGSRHIHDDAPFTLWNSVKFDIRYPTDEEWSWLFKRFDASRIDFDSTELTIATNTPLLQPVPLTIAGCLVRFLPPGGNIPPILSYGEYRRYSTPTRDVFSSPLSRFKFPTLEQRSSIVNALQDEVNMRAVHFLPPFVIVELSVTDGRKYERLTLPEKAGGLKIMYHHAEKGFWPKSHEFCYAELTNLPTAVNDSTNLMDTEKLSPVVRLSSTPNPNGTASMAMAAGILLQRESEKRLAISNHACQHSDEVFHPNPISGQRIDQIRRRLPPPDLALAELDSSVTFDNRCCSEASISQSLVDHTAIEAGEWFHCHAASAGRIVLCARSLSAANSNRDPHSQLEIPYKDWPIDLHFSAFGLPEGPDAQDSIRGAPLVDHNGRVAGLLRSVDRGGLFASVAPMDVLVREGWEVVRD